MTVLIAGGGIAGLTMGLTLHQMGIPFRVYESVQEPKPLGVGINIQPNAVRELFELGLEAMLERSGVRTQEYGFFTKTGLEIWTEPRGLSGGYHWPQYSLHRGKLQMELLAALIERAGPESVVTGHRATGYEQQDGKVALHLINQKGEVTVEGDMLLAADGINSSIRKQMYPQEGEPVWNGAVLWRAISRGKPFRTGASMILAGHDSIRFVAYPITEPDKTTGEADINWIAEMRHDPTESWKVANYNVAADINTFLPTFEGWDFGWLDCPSLIKSADAVFEYPMIDRDPLPQWTDGNVTLIGDAAHPAYPVGSNGASQAIVDARLVGSMFLNHGINSKALEAFEAIVRPQMSKVVMANRSGGGPDGVMQMVEDRCGGSFVNIEEVISHEELANHAASYKKMAGFAITELNERHPLISVEEARATFEVFTRPSCSEM